jgi:hypothetical protein
MILIWNAVTTSRNDAHHWQEVITALFWLGEGGGPHVGVHTEEEGEGCGSCQEDAHLPGATTTS